MPPPRHRTTVQGEIVVVEGTPGLVRGDLVMLNPIYSFVAPAGGAG